MFANRFLSSLLYCLPTQIFSNMLVKKQVKQKTGDAKGTFSICHGEPIFSILNRIILKIMNELTFGQDIITHRSEIKPLRLPNFENCSG